MAAVKKLNTSYTLDTADVYLTGNLHVSGVYDTTTVTNTNIQDRDIALNVGAGNEWGVGGNASPGTSGVIIDRGGLANVSLRWNDAFDKWQLTNNGITYSNIATSSTGLTAVVDDPIPQLGGNLATNGYHINFQTPTIVPSSAAAGNTLVYAGAVSGGGTGLYVVNGTVANQELVTKTQAIVFSLIL